MLRRWKVLTFAATLAILAGTAATWAPEAWADAAAPAARAAEGGTFAGAFFVSRKAGPDNEWSIEILGSVIIWFLLALSVVSLGLIGSMALTNQRRSILPDEVVDEADRLLKAGNFREAVDLAHRDESFFSKVLAAGLSEASHGYDAMMRGLEIASDHHATERRRKIEYLNVLGQVSPMIGLFGTVYGMILAFYSIVAAGGNADPVQLAGGIGTALMTTFWGLVVAIPALAGYAFLRNRIDALTTEATYAAEALLNQFRPRKERGGRRTTAAPAGVEATTA